MTETLLNVSTQPHIKIKNLNLWYGEKQAVPLQKILSNDTIE